MKRVFTLLLFCLIGCGDEPTLLGLYRGVPITQSDTCHGDMADFELAKRGLDKLATYYGIETFPYPAKVIFMSEGERRLWCQRSSIPEGCYTVDAGGEWFIAVSCEWGSQFRHDDLVAHNYLHHHEKVLAGTVDVADYGNKCHVNQVWIDLELQCIEIDPILRYACGNAIANACLWPSKD